MFTGIIEATGTIEAVQKTETVTKLTIHAPTIAPKLHQGDSIAVDGVCLTVTDNNAKNATISVDAIPETIARTIIDTYTTQTIVNLETPLTLEKFISGHLVQGHTDGTARVVTMTKNKSVATLEIEPPPALMRFLALKGSITINGVSLTIAHLTDTTCTVELIPETLQKTNLGALATDKHVNIEIDLIARYLDQLLGHKETQTTYQFLRERNFL